MSMSEYELERQANIARNRALLDQLELKSAVADLGLPAKVKAQLKTKAKPIQPSKRVKREIIEVVAPRRQTRSSARLEKSKETVDPNESPSKKRKREAQEEEERRKEEQERLEAEERAREAKRPRHENLDLDKLLELSADSERAGIQATFHTVAQTPQSKRIGLVDAFVSEEDTKEKKLVAELKEKLQRLRIVSRAKVTQDRVYSAAYHPEITKDLIFFGDKHGQLGIWDARAASEENADEDDDIAGNDDKEGGKYWRLQSHWPATSKSSISSIKIDPIDSHSGLHFRDSISKEIYSSEDTLITSIDLPLAGNEMWISDASGGLTHLDLRQDKSKAQWYGVSDQKIGSVSINPANPHFLLTASNSRMLKIWDHRKLQTLAIGLDVANTDEPEFNLEKVEQFAKSKKGQGCLRCEFPHGKSVSSAYWDPRGRSIVSTSYDDTLRLWELDTAKHDSAATFPSFTPFSKIKHNCQTGKWLTILRATWTPNPDVYPHFTIGNMNHALDIFSCKGDLIARLQDPSRVTAVQAVTCSHPNVLERVASGNGSGRCVLWAPPDL